MVILNKLFIKNFFTNHIISRLLLLLSNQITNIVVFSYLIFIFGIDKFGQFSIALIYTQISIIIIEWGYQTHATEKLKKSNDFLFNYFVQTTLIKLIFIVFFILTIFILINFNVINISRSNFFPICLIIFFGSINPLWFLNLYKKTYILLLPNTVGKTLYLLIVLFFFSTDTDYQYIYYLISFNFFFNAVFGYWYIFKNHWSKINFSQFKILKLILESHSFFLASIINHNITSFWGLYVSIACSNSSIGIFVFCEQIYRGMCLITNLVSNSLRIEFINQNFSFFKKYLSKSIVLSLFIIILLIIFVFFMVNFFKFNHIYLYVGILFLLSWILFSVSKIVSIPVLGTTIDMKKINFYILNYGLLNIVLILISLFLQISNILYVVLFITLASLLECIYYLKKMYFLNFK